MYITTMGVINKKLTLLKQELCEDYKTGSYNIDKIVFNFSGSEWEGLSKVAVFVTSDGIIYDVPLANDECIIPPEIYKPKNLKPTELTNSFIIYVGVYGIIIEDEVAEKIHPTNLVSMPLNIGSYFPRNCTTQ